MLATRSATRRESHVELVGRDHDRSVDPQALTGGHSNISASDGHAPIVAWPPAVTVRFFEPDDHQNDPPGTKNGGRR